MTRHGKQLAIYKGLCYQTKARGGRSSVARNELNSIRNSNLQNKTTLYLNDKQSAAITSWILPGNFYPGEKLESTNLTKKNHVRYHVEGHKGLSSYNDQKRSNIFHGIAGFFAKQGEAWETVKNKDMPVIMNMTNEAWETIRNKDIPVIMNAPNKAWKTIQNNANPLVMNVSNGLPNINQLKLIAKELGDKLQSLKDPKTGKLKSEYKDFIGFMSFIISMGLLRDRPNPNAARITQYFMHFFNNTIQNDISSVNSDPNGVNSGVKCVNEDINSVNNNDIDLNENINSWHQDLKQSPEFQRFYQNYKNNIRMAHTYIDEAVQSFELVDKDNTQRILEQLHKFKNQVAGIMAIGMIFVGNNTILEIPQADTSGAIDQIGENKSITEMSSEEPQADTPAENNQVGENVSILDQLWGLSRYGPTVIAICMLILGADTTSFGFVSVLYRLVCYFSKKD